MPEPPSPPPRLPPRHVELAPALAFVVSIVAGLALAVVYWVGGQPQLEGVLLALCLGGIGVGMVMWAKRFLPGGPEVEDRGRLGSTEAEIDAFRDDFQSGEHSLERRGLLVKLLVAAGGALGLAAIFPIRSLGPRPGPFLTNSPFQKGTRLVREDGTPVKADDVEVDGVITVFPEGEVTQEFAQTLLIRLQPGRNQPVSGREGWTPRDLAAYSKICTHVGCPVGLYEAQLGELLCPCHQSTFAVYEGCRPIFGPAATPLPQLPLAVDDAGFVFADGPFSGPIGPGFWDQQRLWERNTSDQPGPDDGGGS
jgi:ubiquinol-cytochrome c reductase iron-sulfur subunit